MTNADVVTAFLRGEYAKTENLKSSDNKLFSYATCIAEFTSAGHIIINMTPYSTTSSRHRNTLIRRADGRYDIIEVNDVPRGTDSLREYVE